MVSILDDRVNRLTGYKALHGLALSLVSIFIPIFIAQQGFNPSIVFGFLLVDVTAFTILALPVGWTTSKIGVKTSLLSSSILYVLVFVLLQTIHLTASSIYFLAVLIGLAKAFHWIPVNTEFTAGSNTKNRGTSYGKLEGIPKILGPLAPFIGAGIMVNFGFNILVFVSMFFALFSVLPLLPGESVKTPGFNLEKLSNIGKIDLWFLYFLDGFATTAYVFIFPLFVYYVIGGTLNVGSSKGLMAVGAGSFSIMVGRITDLVGEDNLLLTGAVMSGALYFLIPDLESLYAALLVSFLAGLAYTVYTIPLISIIADVAEDYNLLGFFSIREVFQGLGKITVVGITTFLTLNNPLKTVFKSTFYLASVSVVLLVFTAVLVKKRRLRKKEIF